MKLFDAQVRSDTRSDDELRNLAYFGTERAVTTAHAPRRFDDSDDALAYFQGLLDDEHERLGRCGIDARVGLGLLPAAAPRRAHPELWPHLETLLGDPRVVAVGEIGVWSDETRQWRSFERQACLAKEHGIAVIVTPPKKLRVTMTYKMMDVLEQHGPPPNRCLMNHLDAPLLSTVCEQGFMGGIAVGYGHWDPRDAAKLVAELIDRHPTLLEHITLNSSLSRGAADILGMPKTVEALRDLGATGHMLECLVYANAARLFARD